MRDPHPREAIVLPERRLPRRLRPLCLPARLRRQHLRAPRSAAGTPSPTRAPAERQHDRRTGVGGQLHHRAPLRPHTDRARAGLENDGVSGQQKFQY